jgi:hypothetical protein
MDVGIPPPRQLCENVIIRLAINPIRSAPPMSKGRNCGSRRTFSYIFSDNSTTWLEAILKATTNSDETTPVMIENTRHGIRRFLM